MSIIRRNIVDDLIQWKSRKNRKPLILRGARQVGKTTVVKELGKTYKQAIFLNLENPADKEFFDGFTDMKTLVDSLFISRNITSDIHDVLVFIDEIQESPQAIQMLRYFYEDIPELHVIAAGSLLEFAFGEVKSFPVGRVEYMYLYPLNFLEFLEGIDHRRAIDEMHIVPVQEHAHQTLLTLFNTYAIIGGMPEIVKQYVEDEQINTLGNIYASIWDTYKRDVEKYAKGNVEKNIIRHIMNTAPFLIEERIKFQNFGNSNYRSREVSEAMRSLMDARILRIIYPTTSTEFPIIPDIRKAPKLQILDTGIVNYTLKVQSSMLSMDDLSEAYKGKIIPHIIFQELISTQTIHDESPHFWVREKRQAQAEVDILLQVHQQLIPVEIKSGATGSLRSLHQYIDQTQQKYAVRVYGGKFIVENTKTPKGTAYTLMNVPYYLGTKLYEYIEWFLESH